MPPVELEDAKAVCATIASWSSSWMSIAEAPFIACVPAWSVSERLTAAALLVGDRAVGLGRLRGRRDRAGVLGDLNELRDRLRADPGAPRPVLHRRLGGDCEIRRDRRRARRVARVPIADDLCSTRALASAIWTTSVSCPLHWTSNPSPRCPCWKTDCSLSETTRRARRAPRRRPQPPPSSAWTPTASAAASCATSTCWPGPLLEHTCALRRRRAGRSPGRP